MTEWMRRPAPREAEVAAALRGHAVEAIDHLGPVSAAEKLGLAADSVRRLMMRNPWSLEEAFRVSDALHLGVVDQIGRAVR
jgi:hypothetical protein